MMQNNKSENKKFIEAKKHWENIYQTKNPNEMSWHQENPKTSINLILSLNLSKDAKIIDIGGGDSNLADNLIKLGFKDISVLDISEIALEKAKKKLGDRADSVRWIVSDLREFKTEERYDLWHDRAVLHFLTAEEDIKKYVEIVRKLLKPNGHLIVSTFSLNGPKKCSGLDVKQYSEDSVKKLFYDFEHMKSFEEIHKTPFKTSQSFIWSLFKKIDRNL